MSVNLNMNGSVLHERVLILSNPAPSAGLILVRQPRPPTHGRPNRPPPRARENPPAPTVRASIQRSVQGADRRGQRQRVFEDGVRLCAPESGAGQADRRLSALAVVSVEQLAGVSEATPAAVAVAAGRLAVGGVSDSSGQCGGTAPMGGAGVGAAGQGGRAEGGDGGAAEAGDDGAGEMDCGAVADGSGWVCASSVLCPAERKRELR
jgi:hypothetical protein